MPTRRDIFINGGIYHIFNKTIDHKNVFKSESIGRIFLQLFNYYRSTKSTIRYSYFRKLPEKIKTYRETQLRHKKYFKLDILAYCLMPNHFHLLLKQKKENGIISFMANILNSITRFYNLAFTRKGPLFLPQFRSRMIMNQEQLLHVSRYIHLNPYSSGLVNIPEDLKGYNLSSFQEYLKQSKSNICNTDIILSFFTNGVKQYERFVLDNAEHQKTLENIKYTQKWA